MSKILIAGNALVIEAGYTLEQLKTVEKYQPKALCLYDEDGKMTFKVATGEAGSISTFGATFASASKTNSKKAVITMTIPDYVEDAYAFAEDEVGLAIVNLNKVEAGLAAALAKVETDKAAVRANIVMVGDAPACCEEDCCCDDEPGWGE